ncbi:FAD/NAD-P-binding domain-containing protein [Gloeopeniophorella convolvens]|nr:FAD/NAD-P-binding domain-containing protein [Gloeopeniophorella convolvens]
MAQSYGQKNIVVVGGGIAGSWLSSNLVKKLNPQLHTLTIVTARPFFLHLPAAVRATTTSEGSLEERIFIPYSNLFKGDIGEVKIGRVVSIEGRTEGGGNLVLSNGDRVAYDVLVLAPGSTWSGPLDLPDDHDDAVAHVREWRRKFEDASSVVIVGGGVTGVEYAGELKDFYPEKDVTIVHARSQILNEVYPDKFRKRVYDGVADRGVNVVYNDYVDGLASNGAVTTRRGTVVKGDLVVPTWGGRPATKFVASLGTSVLDENGYIRVKPTLELESFSGVFAIGDAVSWVEIKNVLRARGHGDVVATNVLAYLNGTTSKTYKGKVEVIVVTNGRERGVFYFGVLWGIMLGNWFSALVKSRELIVKGTRKQLGFSS